MRRYHFYHNVLACLVILALGLFAAGSLRAQTGLASISGVVSDPSGAVIPGANVTLTDTLRGVSFRAQTNASGVYFIKHLIPSTYKVTAGKSGFQTFVVSSFPLATLQSAVLNITLRVGKTTQQVTVKSQVQMVQPSNATLGGVVNGTEIADLPLVNRNVLTLMVLQPGVAPSTPNNYQTAFFTSAVRYSYNGGLESTSDFELDGVSILNQSDISGIMGLSLLPSVESVGQMRVQTNDFSAAYGRSGGGILTMVTKSGTNAFHGDLFEYWQNNALDANSFFSNRSHGKIPPFHYNDFGGSFGGPIIKNRTFFFVAAEHVVNNSGAFSLFSVPTAAERSGDFSQDYNPQGRVKTIYNPFTTTPNAAIPGTYLRTAFPGNIIPSSLMDPVAVKAESYYPAPNLPGLAIPGTSLFAPVNNLGLTAVASSPTTEVDVRVDHNISASKRLFARYDYFKDAFGSPNFFNNPADEGYGTMQVNAHNGALGYTQTFGGTTVLDLRLAFDDFHSYRPGQGLGFNLTTLGLPSSLKAYEDQTNVDQFPGFTMEGYSALGNLNGPYYTTSNYDWIFSGNLSHIMGKHTLTMGAEGRAYFMNYFQTNPVGFNFSNDMTQGPNPLTVSSVAGDGFASFLLGTGDSGSAPYPVRPANGNHYYAQYIEDSFKLTRKLTLDLGFRLEEETATTERYNRMAAIDPTLLNPISKQVTNPFTGQTPWDLYGAYVFPGSGPDSLGRRAIRGLEWKPNPRFGFAYMLNNKTVIRGGYGIFYSVPPDGATREFTSGAFSTSTPWLATLDGIHVNSTLNNAFPQGYIFPPGSSLGALSDVGQTLVSGWPNSLKTAYNQQWNFTVQRQFTPNTMLQVAYAGNKGTHLPYFNESGVATMDQLLPQDESLGSGLLTLVPNPFYGVITTGGPLSQPEVQAGQLLRPFPEWQTVDGIGMGIGNSEYEALQAMFQKRLSGGSTFTAGYTWSKLMSDVADGIWNDAAHIGAGAIRSWYCLRCEHAVSSYDVPHRFTFDGVWLLPFGQGRKWGSGWNGVPDQVLGGWQLNTILTLASGQPLVLSVAQNNTFSFGGGDHPNLIGNPASGFTQSINEWFNTAAFAQPANFTFGNLGRTVTAVRSDWTRDLDLSLFKNFNITERFKLQFRAEAFNLTNSVVFGFPNTTFGTPGFGVIGGQANTPRTIQLALKLFF